MSKINSKPVQTLLAIVAIAGLLLTLIPSILNWQGFMNSSYVNTLMMAGTVLWFIPAIFIFGRTPEEDTL